MCRLFALLLVALSAFAGVRATAADDSVGRHIYRDGLRPTGEPLTAFVSGDVPVLGTQLNCQGCHGRSGMGAAEGAYIVPPIAGPLLFAPSPQPKRPAYDVASLAKLLRDGVTPGGRKLNELMPRYRLGDDEVAALANYLEGLSSDPAPGVDASTLRFATVVTDDVGEAQREAVLEVLRKYFDEKNRQTRLESQRWDRGSTPDSKLPTLFREWVLEEWTLTGPSTTWNEQLERYYQERPVFAMLSGVSSGPWSPIASFCEQREIPCLFPGTDVPAAAAENFYTLYFSRGVALEADLVAQHLVEHPATKVVQMSCGAQGKSGADELRAKLASRGVPTEDIEFSCAAPLPVEQLAARLGDSGSVAVLWVGREQLAGLEQTLPSGRIYVSSTLLERDLAGPLLEAPGPILAAHPYRLPSEADPAFVRFNVWARTRGLEITDPRRQSEAFFACLVANDAIKHLDKYFIRDYVLDMLEHAQGLAAYVPVHPRPTFGPRQRFLTKGGYIVPIGGAGVAAPEWVSP